MLNSTRPRPGQARPGQGQTGHAPAGPRPSQVKASPGHAEPGCARPARARAKGQAGKEPLTKHFQLALASWADLPSPPLCKWISTCMGSRTPPPPPYLASKLAYISKKTITYLRVLFSLLFPCVALLFPCGYHPNLGQYTKRKPPYGLADSLLQITDGTTC